MDFVLKVFASPELKTVFSGKIFGGFCEVIGGASKLFLVKVLGFV